MRTETTFSLRRDQSLPLSSTHFSKGWNQGREEKSEYSDLRGKRRKMGTERQRFICLFSRHKSRDCGIPSYLRNHYSEQKLQPYSLLQS